MPFSLLGTCGNLLGLLCRCRDWSRKSKVVGYREDSKQPPAETPDKWTMGRCRQDIKVKKGDLKRGATGQNRKFSMVADLIVKTESSLRDTPFSHTREIL